MAVFTALPCLQDWRIACNSDENHDTKVWAGFEGHPAPLYAVALGCREMCSESGKPSIERSRPSSRFGHRAGVDKRGQSVCEPTDGVSPNCRTAKVRGRPAPCRRRFDRYGARADDSASSDGLVCVIDDEAAVRCALGSLFQSHALAVALFDTPADFLIHAELDRPSCLVLDVQLNGLSGMDFQRELAARGVTIPIVLMTGHGDIAMSVRGMKGAL